MEVKVIKNEKDNLLIEVDNQTVAEILRVYLNEDDAVTMAAWKRTQPDKPVVFEIKTKGKSAKKALEDAASAVEKDTEKYLDEFKKAIK
ncbi:MAG: RpoL/Rpb11 RNA polymerase subunit family protein [Nanoarchaeota archaeon]